MNKVTVAVACVLFVTAGFAGKSHALDSKYRAKLERSGCDQITESQGCNINKSKEWNIKHGYLTPDPITRKATKKERAEVKAFVEDSILGEETSNAYAALEGYGFKPNRSGEWQKDDIKIKLTIKNFKVVTSVIK